jgi:hypothetical protein
LYIYKRFLQMANFATINFYHFEQNSQLYQWFPARSRI